MEPRNPWHSPHTFCQRLDLRRIVRIRIARKRNNSRKLVPTKATCPTLFLFQISDQLIELQQQQPEKSLPLDPITTLGLNIQEFAFKSIPKRFRSILIRVLVAVLTLFRLRTRLIMPAISLLTRTNCRAYW